MDTDKGITRFEATVVKHTGGHYLLSMLPDWDLFPAVMRGKIRLKGSTTTNPIAVGDRVIFEFPEGCGIPHSDRLDHSDGGAGIGGSGCSEEGAKCSDFVTFENPALIREILPRKNYIIRKSVNLSRQSHIIAANIDRAYIVVTLDFPEIKFPFIDRMLVTCEVYNVPATLVLNKMDLYTKEYKDLLKAFHEIYEGAGYEIMEVSATKGSGVRRLREECKGKISLFSGVSGVGKSSLINALDPSIQPKVGDLSEAYLQGRHITTFYEMYKLASGGFIIDTPGIRGFGLVELKKEEISTYFPEMLRVMDDCKFIPCTHTHEPGCAVKAAVEDGRISYERYNSYLGMLDDEEGSKYRQ